MRIVAEIMKFTKASYRLVPVELDWSKIALAEAKDETSNGARSILLNKVRLFNGLLLAFPN